MGELLPIMRSYDVRGVVGNQLSADTYYALGMGFSKVIAENDSLSGPVVVGYDGRTTSKEFADQFCDALLDQGIEVLSIGRCTTPMLYFAVKELDAGAGAMITASHNPKQYNGLKIVDKNLASLSPLKETLTMAQFVSNASIKDLDVDESKARAPLQIHSILKPYINFLLQHADIPEHIIVAADPGNAVGSISFLPLAENLNIDLIPIHTEIDGNFPNHEANPAKVETLEDVQKTVQKFSCNFGVAFDGDADRIGFVDEKGRPIASDIMGCLVADHMLKEHPGRHIIHELTCTPALNAVLEAHNATHTKTKVGRPNLVKAMTEATSAMFGLESSGHFFFRDFFNADNAMLMFLKVASIVSKSDKPLSELVRKYQVYRTLNENVPVPDAKAAVQNVYNMHSHQKVDTLDGVSLDLHDVSFIIRPSNTEPIVRIVVHGKTLDIAQHAMDELKRTLQQN